MNNDQVAAMDAVKGFLYDYAKKDVESCMTAIASSKPILLMGTNDNEIFGSAADVREAFGRDFSNMDDIRWGEVRHARAETSGELASVIIELPVSFRTDGDEVETLFRYALTLVRENGRWKICSGIASVPFKSGTYTF
ncbi:MAG: nuclear transport factor 2 family protein [Chlorobiaceae bacterium]|nr:nuclear transport factor 2 family protein [Chlorobiaceae bacterium]NTW11559.1 nuclear transport factor 2 family protein [Chlorobiaceae bacterium]